MYIILLLSEILIQHDGGGAVDNKTRTSLSPRAPRSYYHCIARINKYSSSPFIIAARLYTTRPTTATGIIIIIITIRTRNRRRRRVVYTKY